MSVSEDAHGRDLSPQAWTPAFAGVTESLGRRQLSLKPIPMLARVWSASLETTG